jgi:O-antigen ligase
MPVVYLPLDVVDPFRSTASFIISGLAWVMVLTIAPTFPLSPLFRRHRPLIFCLAALTAWLAVTSTLAYHPVAAWRHTALVTAYLAMGLALLGWVDGHPQRRHFLLGILVASVAGQVAVATLQAAKVSLLPLAPGTGLLEDWIRMVETGTMRGAPLGTLGHVNYLSEWLALAAPLAIATLVTTPGTRRWASLPLGVLTAWLIWRADTRAIQLGALLGFPLAAWAVWREHRAAKRLSAGLLTAGSALTAVAAWQWLTHLQSEVAVALRLANWRAAWDIWLAHPVTGAGLGGFKLLSMPVLLAAYPDGPPPHGAVERLLQAHNEPLQLLAELGVVGGAIAAALLIVWARATARNHSWPPLMRFGLLGGVGAFVVASCFGFPLHVPLTGLMLVFVLVLGVADGESEPHGPTGPRWPAVLFVLLLGTAILTVDAWPNYQAHRIAHEGDRHRREGNWPAAEAAYRLADDGMRFNGRLRWFRLEALVRQGRYAEVLSLYDESAREGLGLDAEYWRGLALEGLARPQEALVVYQRMTRFFPANHPLHHAAAARVQGLGVGLK